MHRMSPLLKVRNDFFGASRVPRAFAVDAVQDARHGVLAEVYRQ
jgi:hypothetical protein